MTNEEMTGLVDGLFAVATPNYTPDGKTVLSVINEDDLEKYAVMVNEVNQTAVSPEEQLTENVYYLENGELRSYR